VTNLKLLPIEKQTVLSMLKKDKYNLLFSTFAFQQSIGLSKLNGKEMHKLIRRRISCYVLFQYKHSSGLCALHFLNMRKN
jgi:hypothetical protein